jgi:hypothetical protein
MAPRPQSRQASARALDRARAQADGIRCVAAQGSVPSEPASPEGGEVARSQRRFEADSDWPLVKV